ncbi:hypothetical protein PAXRUDRAFT_160892, partial [Paxillus rubicundulus Ve08.2h10]
LFHAGMPIWLKHHEIEISITNTTNIAKAVAFTCPDAVMRIMYGEAGKSCSPFPCINHGPDGLS